MRDQATSEHLIDVTEIDASGHERTRRIAELIRHPQPRGYTIGALDDARSAFARFTGLEIEWQDPPDIDEGGGNDV